MLVFLLLTVIPEHLETAGNFALFCDHGATIAVSSQVLSGVETKSSSVPQRSNALAFIACAVSLAGVFNHHKPVLISELADGPHVRRMPIQVNWNDGFCAAGDGSFQSFYVQGVSEGIDVYQHRLGAGVGDAESGG